MTEEQKQALIEWLKEGIELREEYGFNGNLLASMRVALAALTAPEDWKQRAEAAEAKLADLAKQEPVCFIHPEMLYCVSDGSRTCGRVCGESLEEISNEDRLPLFTRPAPAADLAELVPDKISFDSAIKVSSDMPGVIAKSFQVGANWMRSAILRNIEEAK